MHAWLDHARVALFRGAWLTLVGALFALGTAVALWRGPALEQPQVAPQRAESLAKRSPEADLCGDVEVQFRPDSTILEAVSLVQSLEGTVVGGPSARGQLRLRFPARARPHAVAALILSGMVAGVSSIAQCP